MDYDAKKTEVFTHTLPGGRSSRLSRALMCMLLVALFGTAAAQPLYKYRGDNGEWIFSDRPPTDGKAVVEVRSLTPVSTKSGIKVSHELIDGTVQLVANNEYHAPAELWVRFDSISGIEYPPPDDRLQWVLPPESKTVLMSLGVLDSTVSPSLEYRYEYMLGDPKASHAPQDPYRVPYALASDYPVSQAYPDAITHTTPDSKYAIDIAMPIGTDIFAARGGVVFEVTASNFKGGTNASDMKLANIVRILHDDGTYAIYAHLNWNSIRVRVGDRVNRGDYIADSGNTGFSSGPHLHFVVVRNVGMALNSVPVQFVGMSSRIVAPATGQVLTAY